MLTSFYTAISGLNANALALNVVGNNLANVNTLGYKSDVISFQDLLSAQTGGVNLGGNPIQIGLGTKVASVSGNFSQGSLKSTTQPSDLAIIGNGFFVTRNDNSNLYTRAGNFTFSGSGRMVSQQGYILQGWMAANGAIDTSTPMQDIVFDPGMTSSPTATTYSQLGVNLDSQAAVGDTYAMAAQVYDSVGATHTLTYTFTKTANNAWSAAITSAEAGVNITPATTAMTFDSSGKLTAPAVPVSVAVTDLPNGAADINFDWRFKDPNANNVVTQFSAPSSTSQTIIDGYSAGNLSSFVVDAEGVVHGIFSNGQITSIGQLALASFSNPQGLVKSGGNCLAQSYSSGSPTVGTAGTGGRGSLSGNTLELSNVDIATEFTTLIISQRGYQANSRVITTSDEVLQEALNLKR